MNRTIRTGLALTLVIALLALVAVSAGCATGDATPAADAKGGPDDTPGSTEPTEAAEPEPASEPGDDGSSAGETTNPPSELTVTLFWISAGENALGVQRTIPYTKAVATAAMKALLAGPTEAEKTTWPAIGTAIPAGTKLLGLTIDDGIAKVDLSGEFDDGGGSFAMLARLAQVVYTLDTFETIDGVELYLDGTKAEVFSSEGIELKGPQTFEDFEGAIPIDA